MIGDIPYPVASVYPRVGGGTMGLTLYSKRVMGLSPRGRGNHVVGQIAGIAFGSIPAWAGEPPCGLTTRPAQPVYPRVGGGTRTLLPAGR